MKNRNASTQPVRTISKERSVVLSAIISQHVMKRIAKMQLSIENTELVDREAVKC